MDPPGPAPPGETKRPSTPPADGEREPRAPSAPQAPPHCLSGNASGLASPDVHHGERDIPAGLVCARRAFFEITLPPVATPLDALADFFHDGQLVQHSFMAWRAALPPRVMVYHLAGDGLPEDDAGDSDELADWYNSATPPAGPADKSGMARTHGHGQIHVAGALA